MPLRHAGARYADYRDGDKTAGFGLAVAKKAGLLALVLAFAKKGLALLAVAGAAVAAWFRRTIGRKPAPEAETAARADDADPDGA